MKSSQECEQRRCARCTASLVVSAHEIPPDAAATQKPTIHGRTRNISKGGLCLVLDRSCQESSLLRCEIFLPDSPVAIPTLAQVRWIDEDSSKEFVIGVEFLLQ